VEVDHLHQLVANVRGLAHTVHVSDEGGRADEHVPHTDLAPAVALPVVGGEARHQPPGLIDLAVEEDPFVGDEDVVEDRQDLLAAETRVSHV
jgi:hypothetical protein